MQSYVVQRGDTLYGISGQFGVSIDEIKTVNNLVNNNIYIGQVLKIPTMSTTTMYIVKKGDTLYSIANKYGVSVSELIRVNNLKGTNLSIGQQLVIPISSDSDNNYIFYTVKVGDNLYDISRRFNTTVDELKRINKLNSNLLSIGQQLKIPIVSNGSNVPETGFNIPLGSSCYGEGYQEPTFVTYTVKSGDNLYRIAKNFSTTVDEIIKLNDLKNTNLSIGQVLKIKEVL